MTHDIVADPPDVHDPGGLEPGSHAGPLHVIQRQEALAALVIIR
jgi:hypothetical protein